MSLQAFESFPVLRSLFRCQPRMVGLLSDLHGHLLCCQLCVVSLLLDLHGHDALEGGRHGGQASVAWRCARMVGSSGSWRPVILRSLFTFMSMLTTGRVALLFGMANTVCLTHFTRNTWFTRQGRGVCCA